MLDEANYHLSPHAEVAFREEVARQMAQPGFANARSVRNDLDRARLRHAHRLAADVGREWSRDELMRLEAQDILEDGFGDQPFGWTDAFDDDAASRGRHSR
jgi:hypothetical protein